MMDRPNGKRHLLEDLNLHDVRIIVAASQPSRIFPKEHEVWLILGAVEIRASRIGSTLKRGCSICEIPTNRNDMGFEAG